MPNQVAKVKKKQRVELLKSPLPFVDAYLFSQPPHGIIPASAGGHLWSVAEHQRECIKIT